MDNLRANDPKARLRSKAGFAHWDDIDVHIHGQTITSGHGFVGIGRKRLLNILPGSRPRELGRAPGIPHRDRASPRCSRPTILLASDGANSKLQIPNRLRRHDRYPPQQVHLARREQSLRGLSFAFRGDATAGSGRTPTSSTTMPRRSSSNAARRRGEALALTRRDAAPEKLFAKYLDGATLSTNAKHLRGSAWLNFPASFAGNWSRGNLYPDGRRGAHRPLLHRLRHQARSKTRSNCWGAARRQSRSRSAGEYLLSVRSKCSKLQTRRATRPNGSSTRPLCQSAAAAIHLFLLTRSRRVSHENLRLRDKVLSVTSRLRFAGKALSGEPPPPMFAPMNARWTDRQPGPWFRRCACIPAKTGS